MLLAIGAPDEPSRRALRGAVLFTDFSGFTPLTERMAAEGPSGAEGMSEVLNWHYRILTDEVAAQGGDVLLFAGDALIALFEDDDDGLAVHRAAASALAMGRTLGAGKPPRNAALGLRAVIGAGGMLAHRVGGTGGHWLTLVGGEALDEAFVTDAHSRPGAVLCAPRAWRAVGSRAKGELLKEGTGAFVHRIESSPDRGAPKIPVVAVNGKVLERQVLPLVRERLMGGHGDFLAEFRDATVVFVRLDALDPGRDGDAPALHTTARIVQSEVNRLDGSLYQMLRDDKGCSVVIAFGLPGQAHDDDPARGADAASTICARLAREGVAAQAGVATGPVFCGAYGGVTRHNYGIIGTTMNRAARLMGKAAGRVIVDETTESRGRRWIEFTPLPAVTLKGIEAPVRVFEPVGRQRKTESHAEPAAMIGRSRELAALQSRLAALAERPGGGGGGAVLVEAEAGMGKSTLLRRALSLASRLDVRVLEGAADSIEQSTAFLALRPVIASLLGVALSASTDEARASVEARLAGLPERLRALAPLLNVVLPLDLPDNELTAQMSGTIRAANLTDLLIALVERAALDRPVVLALEDLHWMDDASLQFCGRMLDAVPGVLLLATLRPMSPVPPSVERLGKGDAREILTLDTLTGDEIVELIRRRLGAATIPVAVKELILAKAEGNPFYSEEMALALREGGHIQIVGGECRLLAADLSAINLPGNVKGIITGRIDRLGAQAQLTLKVASVLGRAFDLATLGAIFPATSDASTLPARLDELTAAELVSAEDAARGRYIFRHALTHETTYGLLPFAQRRPLHAAAAEHIERAHTDDLAPFSARLAYHWSRAERPEKAVRYLGDAGRQALESWANQSAVEFFTEALRIDESLRGPLRVDPLRASWHRQLAEGHYSLIQWEAARTHYEQAIRLCGFPRPRFGVATPVQVVKHIAGRHAPRLVFGDVTARTEAERAAGIEALRACDNLQVVYLWQGNQLSLAHTVFEGANIAARTGPCAESAFANAMMGYLLMVAGVRGVAERDLRRAVEMADASGQLLQQVSTNMYLGMSLSLLGRPREGVVYLTRADELVSRLGAGLWKHRGKYMLAEPHLMLCNLDTAADLFAACATISMSVEPPITGFANAMVALCRIRQGRPADGIALIHGPTGIRLVRDNPIGLQLYNSLGALIEGYLWTGDWRAALEAAREAVAIPERGGDANSFFTGYNGHAAVLRLFLTMIEWRASGAAGTDALPADTELWTLARRATRNFRKGARVFPGARAPLLVLEGKAASLQGDRARATATLQRAADAAERAEMPYELAMANYELGRLTANAAERVRRLELARDGFTRCGMPRYAERCAVPEQPLHPFVAPQ